MKHLRTTAMLALTFTLSTTLAVTGCGEQENSPAASTGPAAPVQRNGYEIPIPSREYWDTTNVLKFEYEMRYDVDGRLKRNGWSRAYFSSGQLEREGSYTNDERVGIWNFYDREGNPSRKEDRKGIVIWTGPGQDAVIPGTEP